MKKDYESKIICSIEEISYPDCAIRYNLKGKDEQGKWSEGLYNEVELIAHILEKIGKIKISKVFISPK